VRLSAQTLGGVKTLSARSSWLLAARLLAALSIAAAAYAAYVAVSATGDRTWPSVLGRPLAARFTGIVSPVPPAYPGIGGGTSVVSRWDVTYEYEVAGQRYHGEATTGSHPKGNVVVYYSPDHPEISALEPGIDLFLVASLLALSGFLFFASQFARGASSSAA